MSENVTTMLEVIISNVEKVIVGKREAIELALCAFLCKGHVLIEDLPGVGKTSLVSAIAKSFDCSFRRIQFTPDILPTDVTGFSIYNPKTNTFDYQEGAIMAQIVLVDEINRTSPKTQSSLLEVMEESQVTVDGKTFPMPKPFIVFATQNPIEYVGTYPLPEAQLDRFFMRLSLGYPNAEEECHLLNRFNQKEPLSQLTAVSNVRQLLRLQDLVQTIHVEESINQYIVTLVQKTRIHPEIALGCSPRASLALYRASQAWALYNGRSYVTPDDVLKMITPVLSHRLVLKQEAKFKKRSESDVLEGIVKKTKVPV